MPPWFAAFLTAAVVALVAVPRLRRVALASGFVDVPDPRKVHRAPVPYLGGVALILAVLAAVVYQTRWSREGAVLVLAAALLGTMGLIDDDRSLSPRTRLLAELGAAVMVVAVGVRIHATGSEAVDIVLTLVWIVGVTNAFNLLDNMDALAAGVAGVAAFSVFCLAVLAGQSGVATLAAGTAGACLGFLIYNRPPASIFMGDAGSLFLGFVVAVLTVDVSPVLNPPVSFVIPLMLLALPVLDTTTVTLARLRRGQAVSEGGKDHLSHRLAVRTGSRGRAVAWLVGVEAVMATLALLAGRRVIPLWLAVALGVATLVALAAATVPVPVYDRPVVGIARKYRLAAVAAVVALPVLAAPAVLAMARAVGPAREAAALARQASQAMEVGDTAAGVATFDQAARAFADARDELAGPLPTLGLVVPVVSSNVAAARALVAIGEELSVAGSKLGRLADPSDLPISDGRVELDRVRTMASTLSEVAAVVEDDRRRLRRLEPAFLVPPLRQAVEDLGGQLAARQESIGNAAEAARLLPALLGGDGTRRYFLAFENNAELRGTGGLIGNWGELSATDGRLSLDHFGRLVELEIARLDSPPVDLPDDFTQRWGVFPVADQWQHVNVSPDFPTTAGVITRKYEHVTGRAIDGVISIDPLGLSALLELTGPVVVDGWPEPITSANVADVMLKEVYARYPVERDAERVELLGRVAQTVTERFTSVELHSAPALIAALDRAARGGHLKVHLENPEAQALMTRLAADGSIGAVQGDSLMVVNQNLAANKLDAYLQRAVRYTFEVRPDGTTARVSGEVAVTLRNAVPSLGLPSSVIGPYNDRFRTGENRSYVSLYSPFATGPVTLEGAPMEAATHRDLGRLARSAVVSMDAGSEQTLTFGISGRAALGPGGWYRLDLLRQPTLNPDTVDVSMSVPDGWRIAEVRGGTVSDDGKAVSHARLDEAKTIWIRLEPTGLNEVWERLMGRM